MALTLNRADREEIIATLVTNCGGWDEDDIELLANMQDEKLFSHVSNCADLIANEDIDEDGLPGSLDSAPSSALSGETRTGEEEETLGPEAQGGGGPPAGTPKTEEQDQPTMKKGQGEEDEDEEMTDNEYLATLPPRVRSVVANALQFEHQQKVDLVEGITANSRNEFNPDFLMTKSLRELELLSRLAGPTRNQRGAPVYIGASGGPIINQEGVDRDDILTIPTLEFSSAN